MSRIPRILSAYAPAGILIVLGLLPPPRALAQPGGSPQQVTAPSAAAADPESGTEIVFLGTAGGPPLRLDRSEPATLLIVNGHEFLIDCGIGTMRRMVEAGIESERIRTIFFTHLHADHDLGLADVMANDFLHTGPGPAEPISIYGPPQTKELVAAAFHFITVGFRPFAAESPAGFHMAGGALASPFAAHEFDRDGRIFAGDGIEVVAAGNSHYRLMPAQQRKELKSYSYRIRTPSGVIVFTGDTGPSDGVARLARGADVLVAEASYRDPADLERLVHSMAARFRWSPERARTFRAHFQFEHLDTGMIGRLAAKAGVRAVLLYHYDPEGKADQAAYVRGVSRYFKGPVFAPDDLDRYCMSEGAVHPCPVRAAH